jgi:hypothetical protein
VVCVLLQTLADREAVHASSVAALQSEMSSLQSAVRDSEGSVAAMKAASARAASDASAAVEAERQRVAELHDTVAVMQRAYEAMRAQVGGCGWLV